MIILCNTLLTSDKVKPIPAEIGTTINPTPVTDKVTYVVVAPTKTVSTDSSIEVSV